MSGKRKPTCSKCGRVLTDPYSIAVGMGPECRGGAARSGAKLPKPKWRVQGGRVVFLGVEAQEPPATQEVSVSPQVWMRAERPAVSESEPPAHWIKIFGKYNLAACQKVVSLEARRVDTMRVALAGAPGKFYWRPSGGAVCDECLKKAQQQA